jgi:hypothetical protein
MMIDDSADFHPLSLTGFLTLVIKFMQDLVPMCLFKKEAAHENAQRH